MDETKVSTVLIRDKFADDGALTLHTEKDLQSLMDQFTHVCREIGLSISIKKTNIMGQDVPTSPSICINNKKFNSYQRPFTECWDLTKRIANSAAVMAKLNKRVRGNNQLTVNTKLKVYQVCVLSNLLYGSESWSTYTRQENPLESFHLHCLWIYCRMYWQAFIVN